MTNRTPTPPAPPRLLSPVVVLAALTLAGWLLCVLWPRVLLLLGVTDYGHWFLDSYAILAALDARRLGVDPAQPNLLDVLHRSHAYTDWWFALRWAGLTRENNFAVGCAWVGAFLLAVMLTARPRNYREAGWLLALLLSPPVLLAVNRANNDLVIFVLLAAAGTAAAGAAWGRQLLAVAAVVLATGLKFYPAVAAGAFLWIRPVRRMPVVALLAVLGAGLTLASVWPQLSRGQFFVDSNVHALGAALLWRDLGWTGAATVWLGPVLVLLAAGGLVRGRFTAGLASRGEPSERLLAAMGGIVLLACFMAGLSFAYRWIYALWLGLWLWRRVAEPPASGRQAWTLRLGCGLVLLCCWLDGLFCLVINLRPAAEIAGHLDAIQHVWRLWTQPLHWLLMTLLAGWLLEGAVATLQEWAASRRTG